MKGKIIEKENIFRFLCVGIATAIFCYLYFLGTTIRSVVMRNSVEKSIALAEHVISESEANYLSLKSSVTRELADSKGFSVTATTKYISYAKGGIELSYNSTR